MIDSLNMQHYGFTDDYQVEVVFLLTCFEKSN